MCSFSCVKKNNITFYNQNIRSVSPHPRNFVVPLLAQRIPLGTGKVHGRGLVLTRAVIQTLRISWRHHLFLSVTWHPIRSQERGAVWRTRKCSNSWAEISTAPASTPAKFEEVHRVKYEFLRPGISTTLTTVSFDVVVLLLSCCCYPGTVKSSGLWHYITERVSQKRFVTSGLNCSFPT